MKTKVEVENRKEGELLRAGLTDPATRALVKVIGALSALPSDRSRRRVMQLVVDQVREDAGLPELAR